MAENRLTEKHYEDDYRVKKYNLSSRNFTNDLSMHNAECEVAINKVIDKLGKLEDIEEKYELPLHIFIKLLIAALDRSELEIYFINDPEHWIYTIRPEETLNLDEKCIEGYDNFTDDGYDVDGQYFEENLYFKDYGKTWALTEEELK